MHNYHSLHLKWLNWVKDWNHLEVTSQNDRKVKIIEVQGHTICCNIGKHKGQTAVMRARPSQGLKEGGSNPKPLSDITQLYDMEEC